MASEIISYAVFSISLYAKKFQAVETYVFTNEIRKQGTYKILKQKTPQDQNPAGYKSI
jgi:hypothetical protein